MQCLQKSTLQFVVVKVESLSCSRLCGEFKGLSHNPTPARTIPQHTVRDNPSTTACIFATQINYKRTQSGSKEVAADAQALLHAVADVQRRVDGFLLDMRKLNHVQPTLPPKGSLTRSVALRSLWAPSQKSRILLSAFQARKSTCLQLHSVLSGILLFRIPTAVPGWRRKGHFVHSELFRWIALDQISIFLRATLQGGKFMAQFVSTVTWSR